jgi:hypothetical protein
MADCVDVGPLISVNINGGFYELGKSYSFSKKCEVAAPFFRLWEDNWPIKPSMSSLARCVGVTNNWAKKVIDELTKTGQLVNPDVTKNAKNVPLVVGLEFTQKEKVFLLALQIQCQFRPNTNYVAKLKDPYNRDISATTISVWFRDRFDYAGTDTDKVTNLIPIDKWMMRNVTRVMSYHASMNMFPNHSTSKFWMRNMCLIRMCFLKKLERTLLPPDTWTQSR